MAGATIPARRRYGGTCAGRCWPSSPAACRTGTAPRTSAGGHVAHPRHAARSGARPRSAGDPRDCPNAVIDHYRRAVVRGSDPSAPRPNSTVHTERSGPARPSCGFELADACSPCWPSCPASLRDALAARPISTSHQADAPARSVCPPPELKPGYRGPLPASALFARCCEIELDRRAASSTTNPTTTHATAGWVIDTLSIGTTPVRRAVEQTGEPRRQPE